MVNLYRVWNTIVPEIRVARDWISPFIFVFPAKISGLPGKKTVLNSTFIDEINGLIACIPIIVQIVLTKGVWGTYLVGIKIVVDETNTVFRQKLKAEIQAGALFSIITCIIIFFSIASIIVIHRFCGKTSREIKPLGFS